MKRVLVINGPNLNMLGVRERNLYGNMTLYELEGMLLDFGEKKGLKVVTFQANEEGSIVSAIHRAKGRFDWIVINPGAFTHTSIAIRDAILSVEIPVIEVHLTNIYGREDFRRRSFISDIATAVISGCGVYSYIFALEYIVNAEK
ncbi:MAG: type II 3-dehydroquinate dehydratase [Thermosulfidibacteraceae bacterium]|jgi:3-dehydroquinate dehydratase-2